VLVTGGGCGNSCAYTSAEIYDPAANSWTLTGNMTIGRQSHTSTLLTDGTVLVAAGTIFQTCGRAHPCPVPSATAEIYDPSTGVFTATGNLNQARTGQTASLLKGGQVLTEGGTNTPASPSSAEFYVPLSLSISAYSLNFGFEELGLTSPPQTVTVTNASNHSVTFASTTISGDYAESNTCSGALTPGEYCTIPVTFTASQSGTRQGTLTLTDNSLGSPTQTIALTGTGEVNAISFSPSSLSFPALRRNSWKWAIDGRSEKLGFWLNSGVAERQ
jgi:hypothetical protein